MKATRILIVLAVVLTMLLASTLAVSAQAGTWVSGIQIQNQSDTDAANITVNFYWAEGTALAGQLAHTFTDTIAAGQSKTYYVPSSPKTAGLPSDFVGSAVASDQPVAANLNTQLPTTAGATTSDPNRVGTSSGVLDPSPKLYFTQVMKAYYGWNSYIAVQNTGADTATVTVKYYSDSDGLEVTAAADTQTIHPYTTYIFRQSDNANLPGDWNGAAVVEAADSKPLAGVANFFNAATSVDTAAFQSYNAFAGGATKLYVPRLVRNYYDYQSGLQIQNVGSAATDVTITYTFAGTNYVQTLTGLLPNAPVALYLPNVTELAPLDALGMSLRTGSAVITSSGEAIVATVNEDNRVGAAIPNHEGRGVTYNAILDGAQTNTVLFPQVTSEYYGYCGGPQVQNVGASSTTVTFVYSMPGHTDVVKTATVASMESASRFRPNEGLGINFNGSCVASAGQPLVGIANMSHRSDIDTRYPVNYGDSFITYNGINK